jgi:hypothetical protein
MDKTNLVKVRREPSSAEFLRVELPAQRYNIQNHEERPPNPKYPRKRHRRSSVAMATEEADFAKGGELECE